MTQTSNDWPLVDPKDDGIRPAGKPDQCFYCRQRVGDLHALDCVIIEKLIEMRVEATVNGRVYLGVWRLKEPHYWTKESSEFHKNESSWCASNLMRERDSGSVSLNRIDPLNQEFPKMLEKHHQVTPPRPCPANKMNRRHDQPAGRRLPKPEKWTVCGIDRTGSGILAWATSEDEAKALAQEKAAEPGCIYAVAREFPIIPPELGDTVILLQNTVDTRQFLVDREVEVAGFHTIDGVLYIVFKTTVQGSASPSPFGWPANHVRVIRRQSTPR